MLMSIGTRQDIVTNMSNTVHPNCVVCSLTNGRGLQLHFLSGDDGAIVAMFVADETLEGYRGMVHGGMICSILDGAMTHCMFAHGKTAVTAEMSTRFRHPVLIRQVADVSARIRQSFHPLYLLEAKIVQGGRVKVAATGKFLDQPRLLVQRQCSHERLCLRNDTR